MFSIRLGCGGVIFYHFGVWKAKKITQKGNNFIFEQKSSV
jgi:hypothetical protein